jgi:hypothetical protein
MGKTIQQPILGQPLALHEGAEGSFPKPGELIDVIELAPLTLNDRRIWNLLMVNAWSTILEDREHVISKSILRGTHVGNERLSDTISRLMGTICVVQVIKNGKPSTRKVQLLGPTVENRNDDGLLYYRFLPELREIIGASDQWGRLQAQVMLCLSSKYAVTLYEMIQKRAGLRHKIFEDFSIAQLRKLLGVPDGKLTRFQDFRRNVMEPAVLEVDALSDCHVRADPQKSGRSVVGYRLSWFKKDEAGLKAAFTELQRHKAGRKARINGSVEEVADTDLWSAPP